MTAPDAATLITTIRRAESFLAERDPMSTNHTPTPWHLDEEDEPQIRSSIGDMVARTYVSTDFPCLDDEDQEECDLTGMANAAFIVLAVNAHDALVSALEAAAEDYLVSPENGLRNWEHVADRFFKETGFRRPDGPGPVNEDRLIAWNRWATANRVRISDLARAALKLARGEA